MAQHKIEPGQTWYHKTGNYPVKVEAVNKNELLIVDKGLHYTATRGWLFIDRKEFRKTFSR